MTSSIVVHTVDKPSEVADIMQKKTNTQLQDYTHAILLVRKLRLSIN